MMKRKLASILLALSMMLTLLPTASAFEQPADTDYWVGLTRAQAVDMINRIAGKTETRDIVLICYPSDGAANISTAITQFASIANRNKYKFYYYACSGGAGDPSRIDEELKKLFAQPSGAWPDWPIAVTYNSSTKNVLCGEYVVTYAPVIGEDGINALYDLMEKNGVTSGSAGADPEPSPSPTSEPSPSPTSEPGPSPTSEPGPNPGPDPAPGPDLPDPPAPELPDGMDRMGWEVLRLVNQYRMGRGLAPLSVFDAIQDAASLRAREIYASYRPDHTRPDGRICWTAYQECGVVYHYSAENIASGQPTPAIVMDSWLHSPGHHRNIVSPRAVHIGVGYYYGTRPSAGAHNWTQDFAASSNCRFSAMELSAEAINGRQGADLESLLMDADLAVTATCYRHGSCTLPLIAAMCTGYDKTSTRDQTITVTYGGQTAQLTIAARHTWDGGQVTQEPTCTEPGVRTYTCTDSGCGRAWTESIPAAGHDFDGGACTSCGTTPDSAVEDALKTGLAPAGLSEEEAAAYAEDLARDQLTALDVTGVAPVIQVVDYAPAVEETPGSPGAYGYLDYTISLSQTGGRHALAARASTVLRLDIPPANAGDVHENAFAVAFDAAGGTVTPAEMSAGPDGTLSSLPTPVRSGYTFDGWFTASEEQVTTSTVFSSDTTVYARWSQNNSGGSSRPDYSYGDEDSSPVYYSISTPSATGGKVTVKPARAAAGDRVTITVTPNGGYQLASLTVAGRNGKPLDLTEKEDGTFTFIMPSRTVTVSAEFEPLPPEPAETPDPEETPELPWNNPFPDVPDTAWYYGAVRFVTEKGLMNGYEDGQFRGEDYLSRAQLAQILYNKEGKPSAGQGISFIDVAAGAWYAGAIAWASEKGIAGGYGDGQFGPDDSITREQLVVMLWRYAGSPASTAALPFLDEQQISGYAREAVCWAVENNMVQGYENGTFDPAGATTRAHAAQILQNYLEPQT